MKKASLARDRKDSFAKAAKRLFPGMEFEDLVAIAARAPQAEVWGVYEFDPERFHSEPRSEDAADLSILSLDFQLKKAQPRDGGDFVGYFEGSQQRVPR